jgi:hypothetical protein
LLGHLEKQRKPAYQPSYFGLLWNDADILIFGRVKDLSPHSPDEAAILSAVTMIEG